MAVAVAGVVTDAAQRQRFLRALGVVPLVLRVPVDVAAVPPSPRPAVPPVAAPVVRSVVCVVLPDAAPTSRDAVAKMFAAIGIDAGVIRWLAATTDHLDAPPPDALAYVAFGHAATRALGAALPSARREAATVVVVASEPAAWRAQPGLRRAVWSALRPLRHAWRTAGH